MNSRIFSLFYYRWGMQTKLKQCSHFATLKMNHCFKFENVPSQKMQTLLNIDVKHVNIVKVFFSINIALIIVGHSERYIFFCNHL